MDWKLNCFLVILVCILSHLVTSYYWIFSPISIDKKIRQAEEYLKTGKLLILY